MKLNKLIKELQKIKDKNGKNFNPKVYMEPSRGNFQDISKVTVDASKDLILW